LRKSDGGFRVEAFNGTFYDKENSQTGSRSFGQRRGTTSPPFNPFSFFFPGVACSPESAVSLVLELVR
jgi:hypothetical protein